MKAFKKSKYRKFFQTSKSMSRSGIGIIGSRGSVYSRSHNGVGWSWSGVMSRSWSETDEYKSWSYTK